MVESNEEPDPAGATPAVPDLSGGLTLALFQRARSGDAEARREAVARIEARVVVAVRQRLRRLGGAMRSITETMDVAQSILLSMLASGSELRFLTDDDVDRYVNRSISNWLINEGQKAQRRGQHARAGDTVLGQLDGGAVRPEDSAAAREKLERVRLAIDELPAAQREPVRLRVLEGLGFAEIGARLGITEDAARGSYRRGFERVMEVICRGE